MANLFARRMDSPGREDFPCLLGAMSFRNFPDFLTYLLPAQTGSRSPHLSGERRDPETGLVQWVGGLFKILVHMEARTAQILFGAAFIFGIVVFLLQGRLIPMYG